MGLFGIGSVRIVIALRCPELKSIAECEGAVSYCKYFYRRKNGGSRGSASRCTHPFLPKKRLSSLSVRGTLLYNVESCPLVEVSLTPHKRGLLDSPLEGVFYGF